VVVSSPLSIETSIAAGSSPGANATTSTLSSVLPMLTAGKKGFAAHRAQACGKARQEADYLALHAVEFAWQIGAEEKITHD